MGKFDLAVYLDPKNGMILPQVLDNQSKSKKWWEERKQNKNGIAA